MHPNNINAKSLLMINIQVYKYRKLEITIGKSKQLISNSAASHQITG